MKYDFEIKRAFTFFTHDKEYKKKITLTSVYLLLAIILMAAIPVLLAVAASGSSNVQFLVLAPILLCAGLILIAIMQGYILETGILRLANPESDLPDLKNIWHKILLCLKAVTGGILLYLPVLIIAVLIYFFDPNYLSRSEPSFSGIGFPLDITANIIYFVLVFLAPALLLNFLEKNSPLEFFNFKKAFGRIKNNFVKYLILLATLFAIQALAGLLVVIFVITIIGILLIPVICVLSSIICMDMLAQFAQISDSKNCENSSNEEE